MAACPLPRGRCEPKTNRDTSLFSRAEDWRQQFRDAYRHRLWLLLHAACTPAPPCTSTARYSLAKGKAGPQSPFGFGPWLCSPLRASAPRIGIQSPADTGELRCACRACCACYFFRRGVGGSPGAPRPRKLPFARCAAHSAHSTVFRGTVTRTGAVTPGGSCSPLRSVRASQGGGGVPPRLGQTWSEACQKSSACAWHGPRQVPSLHRWRTSQRHSERV